MLIRSFTQASKRCVTMAEDCKKLITDFAAWEFCDPPNYAELPTDTNPDRYSYHLVRNCIFSRVSPQPLQGKMRLVCASEDVLTEILDLAPEVAESEAFLDMVSGRALPKGAMPVSHRYGGHQFGKWAGQLGDGRVHNLGEYVNRRGERWVLQLKGSGQTPYSRIGDGRAVLRSSLREMVASEAMHYLGIATTRAAAVAVSEETVARDFFYMGVMRQERTAMTLRLAPNWFRIGSLELLVKAGETAPLRQLCDYIIKENFPEIKSVGTERFVELFTAISHKTLDTLVKWHGFGFTHGVLNTDNMSLLGLTIDYGPFSFIEHFYRKFTPNRSDGEGRYALDRQPDVVLWNLEQLAQSLEPLLGAPQKLQMEEVMQTLDDYCKERLMATFRAKLGLKEPHEGDDVMIIKFLDVMQLTSADFTMTFRQLAEVEPKDMRDASNLQDKWSLLKMVSIKQWAEWLDLYIPRLERESVTEEERRSRMLAMNPVYVVRNWMLELAIRDATKNEFENVRFLMEVLKKPFEYNEEADKRGFSGPPPTWSLGIKLTCSS